MTINEKQELVRLLNIYMLELVEANEKNLEVSALSEHHNYNTYGVKAQYEHARIITSKLAVEIGKELKSYWEL